MERGITSSPCPRMAKGTSLRCVFEMCFLKFSQPLYFSVFGHFVDDLWSNTWRFTEGANKQYIWMFLSSVNLCCVSLIHVCMLFISVRPVCSVLPHHSSFQNVKLLDSFSVNVKVTHLGENFFIE